MNVQLRKGGAVHYTGSDDATDLAPACNPWQTGGNFRVVEHEVTCKKCLTRMAKYAEAEPVEVDVVAETERAIELTEEVAEIAGELAEIAHDSETCRDLDCSICFPPYVPQVGDRIEDDHTAKLGQIRTVVAIRGHLAEIKIEGPMFHAAHYGQEELNEDGTFHRVAIRKAKPAEVEHVEIVDAELVEPVRTPSDCTTVRIGSSIHARQFNAFWTICGMMAADAPVVDFAQTTCPDCCAVITEGREYAPKPGGEQPKRARLRLSNVHVTLNHRGEIVITADDALRGPVEISANEIDSRWLRACVLDMGKLSED